MTSMNRIKCLAKAAEDRVVVDPILKRAMQKADQREKRRLLDAQRGKCRVRLGSHLDEWCALKDDLGFSLHSQLAKFLLDSYRTTTSPKSPAPKPITLLSVSGPSLHRLAFLCHQHGRNCNSPLSILAQPCSSDVPETPVLLWGCKEDHQFYWDPHDCSTELDGDNTKEDVIGVPFPHHHRTVTQENAAKKIAEDGPLINIENKVNLQRTEIKSHDTAIHETLYEKQSGSDANSCLGNVNDEQEQCNDARRITEHTLEERPHMTPGNELPLNPDVFEKQQKHVTVTSLCQSIGLEILVPSAEVGDTEEEDAGLQSVEVSEDTEESFSIDLVNKRPEALRSGRAYRHQRCHNQPSQSHQQALKPTLPFICRRSPRGSKGSRTKADVKEQVSHSKVQLTSVARVTSDVKGQVVGVHGSLPNTNLTKRISHMEETLTEDVTRRKTLSENFEGLAADEEQKELLPAESQHEGAQMSRAVSQEQNAQMEVRENEGQELHNNQCKVKKTSRCKSIIDEELAQICKKRIRKATPQELLMCEFDDCGKIFSKRQYLNYHQKYQHMNQRTFRCSVTECGKTFNFKKHLKEHEKRHSDRRDFICEFCARAFRSSSNLLIHRRIHTGEKPLQCEFCGFTCRQKASLNWHMKKHDADSFYRFPCDICGQRFEKRDNLAAHKSRKHPVPRETEPQDTSQSVASAIHDACHVEASCKDDHTEGLTRDTDQEMILKAPEVVQETLFPEYLDLTESVQEPSQQSTQTPGNAGISLVIVL